MSAEKVNETGTGRCTVVDCGCEAFVPAPGGSGTHCIGRNAAGGTCNHHLDEHEDEE